MSVCKCAGVQVCKCASLQVCKCVGVMNVAGEKYISVFKDNQTTICKSDNFAIVIYEDKET